TSRDWMRSEAERVASPKYQVPSTKYGGSIPYLVLGTLSAPSRRQEGRQELIQPRPHVGPDGDGRATPRRRQLLKEFPLEVQDDRRWPLPRRQPGLGIHGRLPPLDQTRHLLEYHPLGP